MKNTLLITTLLAAGTLGASAAGNIADGISGYTYEDVFTRSTLNGECSPIGTNSRTGVTNYNWDTRGKNQYDINLGEDARYEIVFNVNFKDAASGNFPIFNIYLAAPKNSIVYGNYYDAIGSERGAANAFLHKNDDVGDGDTINAGNSYVLCSWEGSGNYPQWQAPDSKLTNLTTSGNTKAGLHMYSIVVEAFADSSMQDKIKFSYSGPNDSDGSWSSDHVISSSTYNNIAHNAVLDVGYFFDEGETQGMTIQGTFEKDLRKAIPTPETPAPTPTPTPPASPDVPEPSAFGLLAGAGALALVASRRRRR